MRYFSEISYFFQCILLVMANLIALPKQISDYFHNSLITLRCDLVTHHQSTSAKPQEPEGGGPRHVHQLPLWEYSVHKKLLQVYYANRQRVNAGLDSVWQFYWLLGLLLRAYNYLLSSLVLLTHSLTHQLTHSLTHSLARSLAR